MRYQVWYMKPEFFRDGISGARIDPRDLSRTHVHVKEIEATSKDAAVWAMQGENWSPNGEARGLIESLGLEHTSMCTGDVLVDQAGVAYRAGTTGFSQLGRTP